MKKLILSIAMIAFMAGTVSVSFGQEGVKPVKAEKKVVEPQKKVVVEPQKKVAVTQTDSIADFQALTKASEIRFTENEKSIADLKLNNTSQDTVKKSAKSRDIDVLEQKNNSLREELVAYKTDGKTEWKTFKKEFNSDMDKLTGDIKDMQNVAAL
jgi:hypothetical protein